MWRGSVVVMNVQRIIIRLQLLLVFFLRPTTLLAGFRSYTREPCLQQLQTDVSSSFICAPALQKGKNWTWWCKTAWYFSWLFLGKPRESDKLTILPEICHNLSLVTARKQSCLFACWLDVGGAWCMLCSYIKSWGLVLRVWFWISLWTEALILWPYWY